MPWQNISRSWADGSIGRICSFFQRSPPSRWRTAFVDVVTKRLSTWWRSSSHRHLALWRSRFWPYMIPFVITIDQAAAPHSSLAFMFWGEGLFVFPLMLVYTAISCHVFRGKVGPASNHH
jgi:cytochrome bd-type quinol oxidase subunit 2